MMRIICCIVRKKTAATLRAWRPLRLTKVPLQIARLPGPCICTQLSVNVTDQRTLKILLAAFQRALAAHL